MRLSDREVLRESGFKIRLAAQELKSQGINPDAKVSMDLLMTTVDLVKDMLGELSQRLATLEKQVAGVDDRMRYCGEWLPGFEYDAGNLVEHAGGLHVAVQPTNDNNPPHRGNGWVQLTGA